MVASTGILRYPTSTMDINNNRLALSGVAGSFSEEAALIYAQRVGMTPDLVYSVDMEGVLQDLDDGKADWGIFPVVNSRGGLVQMAFKAMGKHTFTLHDELWMEVYQCLMTQEGTTHAEIRQIVSHPQAIAQCERYLRKEFPNVKLVDWEDTAKAAEDLKNGKFDKHTAVIAPSRSAQIYDLELLAKGIQDNHPNLTTFIIVHK